MCVATPLFNMPRSEPITPRTAATSTPFAVPRRRHRVKVPEQLVRAVDQVNDHSELSPTGEPNRVRRMCHWRCLSPATLAAAARGGHQPR